MDQRRQRLAAAYGRGAQDQVGARGLFCDVVSHGLGATLAAPVQRPLMVGKPGIVPSRFGVPQEENHFHVGCPEKSFGNNQLVNCHDTVMPRRYRFCA
jgi:hypothetical protein